jgi:hypothetical protein
LFSWEKCGFWTRAFTSSILYIHTIKKLLVAANQKSLSNLKKSWTSKVLVVAGTALNVLAVVSDGNSGALVAVGCSLIAVGLATSSKRKGNRRLKDSA